MIEHPLPPSERPNLQKAIKETYTIGGIHTVVYKPNIPKELIHFNGFRPVMIAPGLWCTSDHYMVLDLADLLLSQGQAVISFDHRGVFGGQTPSRPEEYHMAQMIADLITIRGGLKEIPEIDAYRTAGLGISIGGVAMAYAEQEKTLHKKSPLFERLVMISPFVDIQSTARYFTNLLKQDQDGLYLVTSSGKKKYVTMDVFKRSADKYKGIDRELLQNIRKSVGLIFGEKDPQFSTTTAVQSLPSDPISLDAYWRSLNDERNMIVFDNSGVARKILITNDPLYFSLDGKQARQIRQIGQVYLIRDGNHNLNNSLNISAERNKIILDRLS